MHAEWTGEERREFLRVDYEKALNFRELKGEKFAPKAEVVSRNVSACGILFRTTKIPPALSSIIWIELDEKMMGICSEIESDLIMHKGGIFGKVVRIAEGEPGESYDVGVAFLRRKNMTEGEIQQLLAEE